MTALASTFASLVAAAAVTNVAYTEAANRDVTVTYALGDESAVVTFDVTTNGASIGGAQLWDATGDVNRLVTPQAGGQSFVWRPTRAAAHALKGQTVKVVVTAWPTNDPPDYMSVNLLNEAAAGSRVRYYPDAASVPGGVHDANYRTSHLLLKKIPAANVTWTMGSGSAETKVDTTDANREVAHTMKFPRNYYMGVFEVTRTQWFLIRGESDALLNGISLKPMGNVPFVKIRECGVQETTPNTAYRYPNAPNPDSFLGQIRTRTGVPLDLPSEAWWEYAARATWGDATWGDGSDMAGAAVDANLARLAAYANNAGELKACGSYAPNDFGLYDMAGNAHEWCLDWGYTARHTLTALADGSVQAHLYDENNPVHLVRGGGCQSDALRCRPARRPWANQTTTAEDYGLRLACPADAY